MHGVGDGGEGVGCRGGADVCGDGDDGERDGWGGDGYICDGGVVEWM